MVVRRTTASVFLVVQQLLVVHGQPNFRTLIAAITIIAIANVVMVKIIGIISLVSFTSTYLISLFHIHITIMIFHLQCHHLTYIFFSSQTLIVTGHEKPYVHLIWPLNMNAEQNI